MLSSFTKSLSNLLDQADEATAESLAHKGTRLPAVHLRCQSAECPSRPVTTQMHAHFPPCHNDF
jgi:hypothetical protein